MSTEVPVHPPRVPAAARTPALRSVACLVTPGADLEAVRQAACLAEGGRLTLIDAHPRGAEDRPRLTAAWRIAAGYGLDPGVRIIHAPPAAPTVLMLASGHDVLVVATGPHELGEVARAAVYQAPGPVLVARALPDDARVTDRILIATDGSAEARAAASIGEDLARRHGSALAAAEAAVGPYALQGAAEVADAIIASARDHDATLVLVGSRGLSGAAALASVSARVAAQAGCSVLVVRPRR